MTTTDEERARHYADMDVDERAVAMADDGVGDPWELLGYFREKLRQCRLEAEGNRDAALRFHTQLQEAKLAAAQRPPVVAGEEVAALLVAVQQHLRSIRVFITSREKMHPCGVDIHDELQAEISVALAALSSPKPSEATTEPGHGG